MHFQAGRLYRQGYNADVDRTVLQFLDNFVAEVAVDADLYSRIKSAIFGEHFRQHVQTGCLVGADQKGSSGRRTLIGYSKQRFVAQPEQPLRVSEQYSSCRR